MSEAGRLPVNPSEFDRGSFRDRDGRVFYRNGQVYRGLSARAAEDWNALSASGLFRELIAERKLIATEEVPASADGWSKVLRHERVPFVTYPFEWSFSMLRDAALLQLEILDRGLSEGLILKDATPYNIQWVGSRPVFIDVSSFERVVPGQIWAGYKQFCELFLYPLLLQAYKGFPFHSLLRANLDGIDAADALRLFSTRDLARRGVFAHVYLHARLQQNFGDTSTDVRRSIGSSGFQLEMIRANVRKLRSLIRSLEWKQSSSTWSDYDNDNSYVAEERQAKEAFVRSSAAERNRALTWDLGCNTGHFSMIAAESSDVVIAMDGDHLAVERLYRRLREANDDTIVPLVMNLANPTSAAGWRSSERKGIVERGRPDLVLALALIHHLVIAANIPLPEVIDWLASLGGDLVIEFVRRSDPMVEKLLRHKTDNYDDYDESVLENGLASRYRIARKEELSRGRRVLYYCVQR